MQLPIFTYRRPPCLGSAVCTDPIANKPPKASASSALRATLQIFEKDTSWSMPALHTLNLSLRLAAAAADKARRKGGGVALEREGSCSPE
eukprot:3234838-Pleurochrysis_carterae.AAC.2